MKTSALPALLWRAVFLSQRLTLEGRKVNGPNLRELDQANGGNRDYNSVSRLLVALEKKGLLRIVVAGGGPKPTEYELTRAAHSYVQSHIEEFVHFLRDPKWLLLARTMIDNSLLLNHPEELEVALRSDNALRERLALRSPESDTDSASLEQQAAAS